MRLIPALMAMAVGSWCAPLGAQWGVFEHPVATFDRGAGNFRLGDMNEDGWLDLVTADAGSDEVRIFRSEGAGAFTLVQLLTGLSGAHLELGDLNGDGHLDIVMRGFDDTAVVFPGSGTGQVLDPVEIPLYGDILWGLGVGDVNGDGIDDLLASTTFTGFLNDNSLEVFLGAPDFELEVIPEMEVNDSGRLLIGDLNGDDHADLFVRSRILWGDGTGTFEIGPALGSGRSTLIWDLQGDGDLDFLKINFADEFVVYHNDGTGEFSLAQVVATNAAIAFLGSGHWNPGPSGDEWLDVVIPMRFDGGDSHIWVMDGNAEGTFDAPDIYASYPNIGGSSAIYDLNEDGFPDVVVGSSGDGELGDGILVHRGREDGSLDEVSSLPSVGWFIDAVITDVNGDGVPDVAAATNELQPDGTAEVRLLVGDGDGGFDAGEVLPVGVNVKQILSADFDGSGSQDLLTVNANSDDVTMLLSDEAGGFLPGVHYPVGNAPRSGVLADFDLDGVSDLAVAIAGEDRVEIYFGDGVGGLTPGPFLNMLGVPDRPVPGDIDGVGGPDLAVPHLSLNSVWFFLSTGDGQFTAIEPLTVSDPHAIALADIDADGMNELLVFHGTNPQLRVYEWNGEGYDLDEVFQLPVALVSVLSVDLDEDGDDDVIGLTGGEDREALIWVSNGGLGSPQSLIFEGNDEETVMLTLGDLDGDCRVDLLGGNLGPETFVVAYNAAFGVDDCNGNGTPDGCEADCNGNGSPDQCDIEMGVSLDDDGNGVPDECEPRFVRGDVNGDGLTVVDDAILFLAALFGNGTIPCLDAADIDDSGTLLLNDAVTLLSFLFVDGPTPAAPYPSCGPDETDDAGGNLGCEGPVSGCP